MLSVLAFSFGVSQQGFKVWFFYFFLFGEAHFRVEGQIAISEDLVSCSNHIILGKPHYFIRVVERFLSGLPFGKSFSQVERTPINFLHGGNVVAVEVELNSLQHPVVKFASFKFTKFIINQ